MGKADCDGARASVDVGVAGGKEDSDEDSRRKGAPRRWMIEDQGGSGGTRELGVARGRMGYDEGGMRRGVSVGSVD